MLIANASAASFGMSISAAFICVGSWLGVESAVEMTSIQQDPKEEMKSSSCYDESVNTNTTSKKRSLRWYTHPLLIALPLLRRWNQQLKKPHMMGYREGGWGIHRGKTAKSFMELVWWCDIGARKSIMGTCSKISGSEWAHLNGYIRGGSQIISGLGPAKTTSLAFVWL